jgi:hypothetical protein
MANKDLFQNHPLFSEDLVFTEQVKVVYAIDYEYLYNCIKHMPYKEYLEIRGRTITTAVIKNAIESSEAAKQKFWERTVVILETRYGFQRPLSNSSAAERMRRKRAGFSS